MGHGIVMNDIDYEALERIRDWMLNWRNQYASDLSEVYVPGEGDYLPIAMVIGEAPGAQEEIQRRPFVGPSGAVLRQLMLTAHLSPKDWQSDDRYYGAANCWLTNVVKFRPPRNRTPTPYEISSVRSLLRAEWLAIGRPSIIIPVGGVALQAVMGRRVSILKTAGKCMQMQSRHIPGTTLNVWPMVHPSFGLRNKAIQPLLEKDWMTLGAWLGAQNY